MDFEFDDDVAERTAIVKSSKKGSKAGKAKRRGSPSLRTLDSLPDELLVDIFLYINPSSLLSIGLVSKRFNAVSEESWRQKCLVKYQSLESHDFERLFLSGKELVQDLGNPKKLYNVRPRRSISSHNSPRPMRASSKNTPRTSVAPAVTFANDPLENQPLSPKHRNLSGGLPLPSTAPIPVGSTTESISADAMSAGSFQTSHKAKKSHSRESSPRSSPKSSPVYIRRKSNPETPSLDIAGEKEKKKKDKGKEKDKSRERDLSDDVDSPSAYPSYLSSSPTPLPDNSLRTIDLTKDSHDAKYLGDPESTENSDDTEDDRVGWKFLYFNKTRIENVRWLVKKDPMWARQFYTREEAKAGGTHERLYKHHLFPTVVRLHQDLVIAGSGAYEMVSDPTTFMIGQRVIRIWDVNSGELLRQLDGHAGAILNLTCRDNLLLSTSRFSARNLLMWDVHTGDLLSTFTGHTRSVFQASFEDNNRILSCSKDKTVRVWDMRDSTIINIYDNFSEPVRCYSMWNNIHGSTMVCAVDDRKLHLLDLFTAKVTAQFDSQKQINAISTIGNTAVVGLSNSINQIDLRSGEVVRHINKKANGSHLGGFIREVYVDEDKLLFSTSEGKLGVVDWNSGKILALLSLAKQRLAFDYDPLSQKVVSGDSHSWVKVWNFGDEDSEPEVERVNRCSIS